MYDPAKIDDAAEVQRKAIRAQVDEEVRRRVWWGLAIAVVVIILVVAYHRGSTGPNAPSANDPPCAATNDLGDVTCE